MRFIRLLDGALLSVSRFSQGRPLKLHRSGRDPVPYAAGLLRLHKAATIVDVIQMRMRSEYLTLLVLASGDGYSTVLHPTASATTCAAGEVKMLRQSMLIIVVSLRRS